MAMTSLKTFAPTLAPWLHLTPNALYERQRALVRAGLLKGATGRGPGSGVEATRESVALLLLTVLVTDQLTDFADSAADVLGACCTKTKTCPVTGARNPVDALSIIMKSEISIRSLLTISCFRLNRGFTFKYILPNEKTSTEVIFAPEPGTGTGTEIMNVPSIFVVSEFIAKPALWYIAEHFPNYVTESAEGKNDNG